MAQIIELRPGDTAWQARYQPVTIALDPDYFETEAQFLEALRRFAALVEEINQLPY